MVQSVFKRHMFIECNQIIESANWLCEMNCGGSSHKFSISIEVLEYFLFHLFCSFRKKSNMMEWFLVDIFLPVDFNKLSSVISVLLRMFYG